MRDKEQWNETQRKKRVRQQTERRCTLAEPGGLWRLTFALGRLENLGFFIQIIYWAPWISQLQSTGLPSIFLRVQPWMRDKEQWNETKRERRGR